MISRTTSHQDGPDAAVDVSGCPDRPGSQLYVNRGIGTIFVPIRLGAPPEITVYKLTRG